MDVAVGMNMTGALDVTAGLEGSVDFCIDDHSTTIKTQICRIDTIIANSRNQNLQEFYSTQKSESSMIEILASK